MTQDGTSPFSEFIKRRQEELRFRYREAKSKRNIVNNFRSIFIKYSIKKAYLFGSILNQSCRPESDIDLYVEDLESDKYWEMWRDLEELANQPVDLYYQHDDSVFVEKVKKRGELIYESGS